MLSWLELPLIVAMLAVFSTGIAMLLSALFVTLARHPADLGRGQPGPLLRSPVIISVETVREKLSHTLLHLYMLNPLAIVFQQFRHAMITHDTLSAGEALGGWAALLGAAGDRRRRLRASASGCSTARRRSSPRTSSRTVRPPPRS